ncbi:MAG TPA: tripartite tricarboxylate transporter substrate-binding protein, partial [Burkholderiales bacterium]|nr:tripartite tricarboxylate transporter substrate-binding protein [Burkholderiales bacterium]
MRRFFLLLAAFASPVFAQTDWPARPVTLINPFAAASAVDVVTRLVAQRLTQNTGKSFLVENRTGASGNIGTEAAAKAKPDGYTFLVGSPGSMAINPFLFKKLPYDAEKDFVAVTTLASFPQVLIVNPQVPAKTLPELIAWVKANPG